MGTGRAIRNTLERQARKAPPKTFRLNVMPFNNAVGAVVTNMGPQNVDTVLIAGKFIKRGGQMVVSISPGCSGLATRPRTASTLPQRSRTTGFDWNW